MSLFRNLSEFSLEFLRNLGRKQLLLYQAAGTWAKNRTATIAVTVQGYPLGVSTALDLYGSE